MATARLTVTMYPADFTSQIAMTEMDMRAYPGRTYRFYTGTPVYEFGDGISYTNVTYGAATLFSPANAALTTALRTPLHVTVDVENTGRMDSDHVVLGMVTSPAKDAVGRRRAAAAGGRCRLGSLTI